ncbi:Ferredoxin subunit of nitrite reductase or a ring-hydroxylating dioxygenase [Methanosarcina thermophila]|jgi:nitrite reductase/ring-hydroxylating ferredoxin subunit|uniref:Ferredoxin subunit of nitrite reductase or a ring-hydroxylating dioxygenase n=3 Tax=Methanosarcina thermophila TaxID=2210 RepID=A0A1I7ANR3_METTE|nr:Ferredoxin subunit of nitrite reductase or a ring-hydroxylating dioxygenase [Methanosarcina thermophila]
MIQVLQKLPGSLHRQVQIRYPFQASSVVENTNVLFKVNTDIGEIVVMDYRFDDKVFVRSNVCPPCNSIGFTLENGTLVCDSCGTVFDAETGTGIGGGCVAFPKESIPYTISEDKITMKLDDVVTAHEKAIEPN